jgi:hypothetical protein
VKPNEIAKKVIAEGELSNIKIPSLGMVDAFELKNHVNSIKVTASHIYINGLAYKSHDCESEFVSRCLAIRDTEEAEREAEALKIIDELLNPPEPIQRYGLYGEER